MRTVLLTLVTVGALAAPAAADEGTGITVSTQFQLGSVKLGDMHGLLAPGGHFDLGFRVRRWRLAAELDTGLWSEAHPAGETMYLSGGFTRAGMALQWDWKDLEMRSGDNKPVHFRGYVEVGLGRQVIDRHVRTPAGEVALGEVARNDIMLGIGMAPELRLGPALFGASFGVRMLIARAPQTTLARGGDASSERSLDVALLYVFGLRFGH